MQKRDSFVYCIHCETVHRKSTWKRFGVEAAERHPDPSVKKMMEKHGECPKCRASGFLDGWDWKQIAEANGYPDQPTEGTYFAMYPSAK